MSFDELFALAPAGADRWTAPQPPQTDEPRLFGGLLLGHAIVAASMGTTRCHALHALFIGAGSKAAAMELAVTRTRDGRSYATRQVELRQEERLLLTGLTSHHEGDEGPEHQIQMPDLPGPETLEDQRVLRARHAEARGRTARNYLGEVMMDARPIEMPLDQAQGVEGRRAVWFKPRQPIRGGTAVHQAAIAFASDMGLVHVGMQAHNTLGDRGPLQATSLDHSLWFHSDGLANDWMLHVQRAPIATQGRGLAHASIFTRDGRLVASAAQEFMARRKPAERSSIKEIQT